MKKIQTENRVNITHLEKNPDIIEYIVGDMMRGIAAKIHEDKLYELRQHLQPKEFDEGIVNVHTYVMPPTEFETVLDIFEKLKYMDMSKEVWCELKKLYDIIIRYKV